jgi:hypothetical protein
VGIVWAAWGSSKSCIRQLISVRPCLISSLFMFCHICHYTRHNSEGHIGMDGRFYLLDLSRSFPPEAPTAVKHMDDIFEDGSIVLVRTKDPEHSSAFTYTKGTVNRAHAFPLKSYRVESYRYFGDYSGRPATLEFSPYLYRPILLPILLPTVYICWM